MSQKPVTQRAAAEKVVKEIRRATRKQHSAEEKIRIVLAGLRGEDSIAEHCRREGDRAEPVLQLVEGVPGGRQAAPGGRHRAAGDQPRGEGAARRGGGAEGGGGRSHPREPAAQKKHDRGWGRPRMRYPAAEKLEIIRLVEGSHLPVRRTLARIGVPATTFYRWYDRYREHGPAGLEDRSPRSSRVWNRIPDPVRQRLLALALEAPELSAARTGRPLHRSGEVFRFRGFGLPPAQGA